MNDHQVDFVNFLASNFKSLVVVTDVSNIKDELSAIFLKEDSTFQESNNIVFNNYIRCVLN